MFGTITDPRQIEHVRDFQVVDVEKELRGDILSRAHELFNYTGDAFNARGPLAKLLSELGISPLDDEQVRAYKDGKEGRWTFDCKKLYWYCAAALYLGMIACFVLFHVYTSPSMVWGSVSILATMFGWVPLLIIGVANSFPMYQRTAEWKRDHIGDYEGYIPVFALNYAVQLKEKCSNASLSVEWLEIRKQRVRRPDPDPFLRVDLGCERYYIAVWDEREFEAKM